MKRFYVATCEKDGDYFELLVTNNEFAAKEKIKNEQHRLSEHDARKSRFYIDVYQARDLDREYPDLGIEAHPNADEWDRLLDEYEIVDTIY